MAVISASYIQNAAWTYVLLLLAQTGENWGSKVNGLPSDTLNIFKLQLGRRSSNKTLKIFSPVLGRSSDLKENFKALFCFLMRQKVGKLIAFSLSITFFVQQNIPTLSSSSWAPWYLSAEERKTLCLANRHLYFRCFSSTDVKKTPCGTCFWRTLSAGLITAVQPRNITPYFCCQKFGYQATVFS